MLGKYRCSRCIRTWGEEAFARPAPGGTRGYTRLRQDVGAPTRRASRCNGSGNRRAAPGTGGTGPPRGNPRENVPRARDNPRERHGVEYSRGRRVPRGAGQLTGYATSGGRNPSREDQGHIR